VAPSGRLYPCERLIGEDDPAYAHALPGHALAGEDFLMDSVPAPNVAPASPECGACTARELCDTTCRCSNLVRTGDAARPDGLLCALNRACLREVARVIRPAPLECATAS
jgi:radical SAM protein with 4Fe4S-binding SPASM domain